VPSKSEMVAWLVSMTLVFIVLGYCAWRITITQQWLADHRVYIQERDATVKEEIKHYRENDGNIMAKVNQYHELMLTNQNTIMKNQAEILKAVKRIEDARP
jgi:uncharacterized membrane protein (DUF106 family)